MKKFLLSLFLSVAFLMGNAQTTNVYFGNITDKLGIGLGFSKVNPNEMVISIMQIAKAKEFDNFSLNFVKADGSPIYMHFVPDTVYHIQTDNTYNHQCDYIISKNDYMILCSQLTAQTTVYINNVEYNGAAFVGVLKSLEQEHNKMYMNEPMGRNFRNVTMWNIKVPDEKQSNHSMELMRFQNPDNHKEFRFIRRGYNDFQHKNMNDHSFFKNPNTPQKELKK